MQTGILYIVATPIGNLEDISARAIRTLQQVQLIAAEDTRHSKKLLQHYLIQTPLMPLHEHNEKNQLAKLIEMLTAGKSIAVISDAGTPLISDPGYHLVAAAQANNIAVVPIPGPCALIAALSVAGLPSDHFIFEGFLPPKTNQRRQRLQELLNETRTIIFYEAPHRIVALIDDMLEIFGAERQAVIARELTKTFETISGGNLAELKTLLATHPEQIRGEYVVLVHGAEQVEKNSELNGEKVLAILLKELPLKQAVDLATKITGEKKNQLYQLALKSRYMKD